MSSTYELFRYHLLPQNRYIQLDALEDLLSIDELIKKKNQLFYLSIQSILKSSPGIKGLQTKLLFDDGEFLVVKVAREKRIHREKDFQGELLDDWPSTIMIIWNAPDKQIIAVKKRSRAFSECKTAVGTIIKHINKRLKTKNLSAEWEPQFERNEFWHMVKLYDHKIKKVEFQFITPNMANLTADLSEELKDLSKTTNSHRSSLNLESDKGATLKIDQENKTIGNLVNYLSKGGGNIKLRIAGLTSKVSTADTIRETTIDEFELESPDLRAEDVVEIIETLKGHIDDESDTQPSS